MVAHALGHLDLNAISSALTARLSWTSRLPPLGHEARCIEEREEMAVTDTAKFNRLKSDIKPVTHSYTPYTHSMFTQPAIGTLRLP
ncbi:hypothetical protein EON63_18955, partial [archaeon]